MGCLESRKKRGTAAASAVLPRGTALCCSYVVVLLTDAAAGMEWLRKRERKRVGEKVR